MRKRERKQKQTREPDPGAKPSPVARPAPLTDAQVDVLAAHARWVETGGREGARASLPGIDLAGRNLAWSVLAGADLPGASLRGADIGGADLRECDLRGADLRGVTLEAWIGHNPLDMARGPWYVDLEGALLEGASLEGLDLRGTSAPGFGPWGGPDEAARKPPLPPRGAPRPAPAPRSEAAGGALAGPVAAAPVPDPDPDPAPEPEPLAAQPAPVAADPLRERTYAADARPDSPLGVTGCWRLAREIALALDPVWPQCADLVQVSEEVDWVTGVDRALSDRAGDGPRYIAVSHWTATDPHLAGGGASSETIGATLVGLESGAVRVSVVPGRRAGQTDTVHVSVRGLDAADGARVAGVVERLLRARVTRGG